MKNFTLNVIMTLVMVLSMSLNVNAAPLYETLEEAQAALDKGVHDANEISLLAMDAEVFGKLKVAIIDATAVWDSNLRNDIDEIERVMPALLDAMEEAKKSVAAYEPLNKAIDAYEQEILLAINAKSEELEEEYEDNEEMWNTLSKALSQYKTYLYNTLCVLKSKANAEMLEAANEGNFDVVSFLKKNDIELISVDEVVDRVAKGEDFNDIITGITHVVVAPSGNKAAYSLNGNKVSEGYKGIVIKDGKKIIMK